MELVCTTCKAATPFACAGAERGVGRAARLAGMRRTGLACTVVVGAVAATIACGPAEDDCVGLEGSSVLVDTASHRMALCQGGESLETFSVRIGRQGAGKTREGDEKTPLGVYPLAQPLPSRDFHVFIPIGYPTPAQRRAGLTGSAVGIHGPHRRVRWLGPLVNLFDTTDGCVGLATDAQIDRVAAWVRAEHAPRVVLR